MPAVWTRMLAAVAFLVTTAACNGPAFGARQYEYDEQLYLYPDGSAAMMINASVPALIALRGLPLDPAPRARIDRAEVRAMVSEPGLEITRVSRPWRRKGRQFIQVRAKIEDVGKLGDTKLFGWSTYSVTLPEGRREYRQMVGPPSGTPPAGAGWDGSEIVAFKLHLPSRVRDHNVRDLETGATGGDPERGNILTWEQRLSDRLRGEPIDMHVSMDDGSILYRTLWLFGLSFGAAIALLVGLIWMVVRRGRQRRSTSLTAP